LTPTGVLRRLRNTVIIPTQIGSFVPIRLRLRLAAGGWRLAAGGWRLAAGGWRLADYGR